MGEYELAMEWDDGRYKFQQKLGNFVQNFQVNLPNNNLGVPLQLINPVPLTDSLLEAETTDDVPLEVLNEAIMVVEYDDGMPTVDGLPIWERFDGEVIAYYKLFKHYRDMASLNGGSRSIVKLSHETNIAGRHLNALAKVYHWQLRCKAYDMNQKIIRERKRQYEIEQMESKHMRASSILLEQGLAYIEDHPEQLNPKVALQMVELAMKSGRLALGLNGDKPGSSDSTTKINIQQNNTQAETATKPVAAPTKEEQDKTVTQLESLIHILDKSGAFDRAKQEVIDADFSEVSVDET